MLRPQLRLRRFPRTSLLRLSRRMLRPQLRLRRFPRTSLLCLSRRMLRPQLRQLPPRRRVHLILLCSP